MISSIVQKVISRLRQAQEKYMGEHEAPDRSNGAPMHNLKGTYPDDIYTMDAVRNYGDGHPYDNSAIAIIQSARNKPNKGIKIYRAVPKVLSVEEKIADIIEQKKYILKHGKVPSNVKNWKDSSDYFDFLCAELEKLKALPPEPQKKKVTLNKGDWVTLSREYAKEHGQANLKGLYQIISKTVKAKDLYTDGNSIHEWGYGP